MKHVKANLDKAAIIAVISAKLGEVENCQITDDYSGQICFVTFQDGGFEQILVKMCEGVQWDIDGDQKWMSVPPSNRVPLLSWFSEIVQFPGKTLKQHGQYFKN